MSGHDADLRWAEGRAEVETFNQHDATQLLNAEGFFPADFAENMLGVPNATRQAQIIRGEIFLYGSTLAANTERVNLELHAMNEALRRIPANTIDTNGVDLDLRKKAQCLFMASIFLLYGTPDYTYSSPEELMNLNKRLAALFYVRYNILAQDKAPETIDFADLLRETPPPPRPIKNANLMV